MALSLIWALAYSLARSLSTPIQQMRQKLREMDSGRYQTSTLPDIHHGELGELSQHINMLAETLQTRKECNKKTPPNCSMPISKRSAPIKPNLIF